ncbi:Acid trehalase [Erysiphe neolycopersici]|uniref:alpha,alpha-trehalase n=1 Tax=Erysiphe neolycopersici TaxID=212602 RepID=A0A420I0Y8_9PEZI|nr:Acid trehalase [Erysiphe neolycopersici]
MMIGITLFLFLVFKFVESNPSSSHFSSPFVKWNQDTWTLSYTKYDPGVFQNWMAIANGYVGAAMAAIGPMYEEASRTDGTGVTSRNGWPLYNPRITFSTVSGFWDIQENATGSNFPELSQNGWDSFISGIPHPTSILFSFFGQELNNSIRISDISNFNSSINMRDGVNEWHYTWTPTVVHSHNISFDIHYKVITHRNIPNIWAIEARVSASDDVNGTVTDLLDGRSSLRSYLNAKGIDQKTDDNFHTIYTSVHPDGLENTTAWLVSGVDFNNKYIDINSRRKAAVHGPLQHDKRVDSTTIGQTFDIFLKKNEPVVLHKFVSVASTDKFSRPEKTARLMLKLALRSGFNNLLKSHVKAWRELLSVEKVDDFRDPVTRRLPEATGENYIKYLQISAVANPYYLLSNLRPDDQSNLNDNSISVCGLTSDCYGGQNFWDAPTWMAPGISVTFPGYAKQINNLYKKQYPQALENANIYSFPKGSALYPWTSGRYGNCTATGPCVDYEYHKNLDIAMSLHQLKVITGNDTWFWEGPNSAAKIVDSVATSMSHLLSYNHTTKSFWIYNMTDPDEYANHVNNGAFTLAATAKVLFLANSLRNEQGLPIIDLWEFQRENIKLPVAESNITLEYEGMNNSVIVKQADVILISYINYHTNYPVSRQVLDLDYYALKQTPDGPAMTYSVFASVANKFVGQGSASYTYTLKAILPYLRAPWFQMSEQVDDNFAKGRTHPAAFPFLTGNGGANQIVPFGFLGLNLDGPVLIIDPSLPPQIPYLRTRTMHFNGATFFVMMNNSNSTIVRIPTALSSGLKDGYGNGTMPFCVGHFKKCDTPYEIGLNEAITIWNRKDWKISSYANNIIQNLPVWSEDDHISGELPLAAVDGSTATFWQPQKDNSAFLFIDTKQITSTSIKKIHFYWGLRHPKAVEVSVSNSTDWQNREAYVMIGKINQIRASNPYSVEIENNSHVVPVTGNETTIILPEQSIWTGRFLRIEITGCSAEDGKGATVGEISVIG